MPREENIGLVKTQFYTFADPPHEMVLGSGDKLSPITLVYEIYGDLTPEKDNAILITHALSYLYITKAMDYFDVGEGTSPSTKPCQASSQKY